MVWRDGEKASGIGPIGFQVKNVRIRSIHARQTQNDCGFRGHCKSCPKERPHGEPPRHEPTSFLALEPQDLSASEPWRRNTARSKNGPDEVGSGWSHPRPVNGALFRQERRHILGG